jgi:nucleoside-diphosphate-sugar epimerase
MKVAELMGHEVVGLTIKRPGRPSSPRSSCFISDGIDVQSLRRTLKNEKFDWLIHLASYGVVPTDRDAEQMEKVNVRYGWHLAELLPDLSVRAAIAAGSSAEYAARGMQMFRETDPLEEGAPYGRTKALGGLKFLNECSRNATSAAVFRLFNVYGPGEAPHRLLPSLATQLSIGARVALSPGDQIRDFIFVDDVCTSLLDACLRLDTGQSRGGAYNLCSGMGMNVKTFAKHVAQLMGKDEDLLQFSALPRRPHEQMFVVGDPTAYKMAFGTVLPTSVKAGIQQSLIYLQSDAWDSKSEN